MKLKYNIGIGFTGECNLDCPHCYSQKYRNQSLDIQSIKKLVQSYDISSINFGTGESILHPEFIELVEYLSERNIPLSLTSNGYSIGVLQRKTLRLFHDVDVSIDFPERKLHDQFRGNGAWNYATRALSICKENGVEVSVVTTLMKNNYMHIERYLELLEKYDCNLRVNLVKDYSDGNVFSLSYDEFWNSMKSLFNNYFILSCSEPLVNALYNIDKSTLTSPCGQSSFRVHPNGNIVPCVYWSDGNLHLDQLNIEVECIENDSEFVRIRTVPPYCAENCEYVKKCGGGCASRRMLNGDLLSPDQYCPIYINREVPKLNLKYTVQNLNLIHSNYLCTFIFSHK